MWFIKEDIHYLDQGIYILNMLANILAAKDFNNIPDLLKHCLTALQQFGLLPSPVLEEVWAVARFMIYDS